MAPVQENTSSCDEIRNAGLLLSKHCASTQIATDTKVPIKSPVPVTLCSLPTTRTMAVFNVLVFIAINLIQSFAATPPSCKMLPPKKIDPKSTTFSGKWHFLRWATQYEPYRKEFGQVDNSLLMILPVVQTDKVPMKGYMRIGDNCASEIETYHLSRNGVDFTSEAKPFMVFRMLDTKIQDSLLFHIEEKRDGKMYHTLCLYGRNPVAMENEVKIFEEQVQCAGMKKDKIIVPPRLKDECKPQDTVEALI
ncbi:uncharacterized protein [Mobula birostris]|uniref:uncharacterized protein n=1 Tax=Mobula birostris TaxID=1983395 RepID=UPI003B2898D2